MDQAPWVVMQISVQLQLLTHSNITMKGFTLETTVDNTCMILDSTKNSIFEDVKVKGAWISDSQFQQLTLESQMNNPSTTVAPNNTFINCSFSNPSYGMQSDWDILITISKDCESRDSGYGIGFGTGLVSLDVHKAVVKNKDDPKYNNLLLFSDIHKHAIWAKFGVKNTLALTNLTCVVMMVVQTVPAVSVIHFEQVGNVSREDFPEQVLSYDASYWDSAKYVPEIEGAVDAEFGEVHVLNTITRTGTDANGIVHPKDLDYPRR